MRVQIARGHVLRFPLCVLRLSLGMMKHPDTPLALSLPLSLSIFSFLSHPFSNPPLPMASVMVVLKCREGASLLTPEESACLLNGVKGIQGL